MSGPTVDVDLFDPKTNDWPYPAYERLRDEAPVWKDPRTGMYLITRFDDVRMVLLDTRRFSNEVGNAATRNELAVSPDDPLASPEQAAVAGRAERVRKLYEEKGWLAAPNLDALDEPVHMERRRLFDHVFRAAAIRELDPLIEEIAQGLVAGFVADGRCEWISQFAIPLPLTLIGRIVGVPDGDLPQIKRWTDAAVQRMSLQQSDEETLWSVEMDIEMQHYFQRRFETLRAAPDDSFLSALVNTAVPEWGRPMNDNELHGEMRSDLFVGGAETTTHALAEGVVLLVKQPEVWRALKADADRHLPTFIEEVLRVESPVQGLLRKTKVDVELHGVTIPAGSMVNVRYGAANRDERAFACPAEVDLERAKPRRHLAFGTGAHVCLGAPLARRELFFGFKALIDGVDELWFIEGANDFAYSPNYVLRALEQLHIGFTPANAPGDGVRRRPTTNGGAADE